LTDDNEANKRLVHVSMHKFRDHIVSLQDLTMGTVIGAGSAGAVFRAKLRRHTDVAVKSVLMPVSCYLTLRVVVLVVLVVLVLVWWAREDGCELVVVVVVVRRSWSLLFVVVVVSGV
jgi:hypothetical protein